MSGKLYAVVTASKKRRLRAKRLREARGRHGYVSRAGSGCGPATAQASHRQPAVAHAQPMIVSATVNGTRPDPWQT